MIRDKISGTFDREELGKLSWPIAWSGTTPESDRREEEVALSSLIREGLEAIDACPVGVAVEIENGQITAVVTED